MGAVIDSEYREGAHVVHLRCIDPCLHTPGAIRRAGTFIDQLLKEMGVRVDKCAKGKDRWLSDPAFSPGIARRMATECLPTTRWLGEVLLPTVFEAHCPDLVVVSDHLHCKEREQVFGRLTPHEERRQIEESLLGAEQWFREWEATNLPSRPKVRVELAVGLNTSHTAACHRRFNGLVSLRTFLEMDEQTVTHATLHPILDATSLSV